MNGSKSLFWFLVILAELLAPGLHTLSLIHI